ncbi:sulfotransferase family protein [Nitzschia inconspicua]|uniref:Sulfotransferase family protein n=1 Tax=Nitzschia inconspicua TaxID=303405 RepID=A0A9K3KMR6_9STRA|nr:sulfotransferase family protein [Nitzschia inconspicua]
MSIRGRKIRNNSDNEKTVKTSASSSIMRATSAQSRTMSTLLFILGPALLLLVLMRPMPMSIDQEVNTLVSQETIQSRLMPTKLPSPVVVNADNTILIHQKKSEEKVTAEDDDSKEEDDEDDDDENNEDDKANKNQDPTATTLSTFHTDPILRYLEKELSNNQNFQIQDSKVYQQANCIVPDDQEFCPSPDSDDAWRLRTPGFLIIGAKKAGTTSFWQSLTQHPDIVGASRKEILFFTQVQFDFAKYTKMVDERLAQRMTELSDDKLVDSDLFQHYANASAFQIRVAPSRADLVTNFPRKTLRNRPNAVSLDATPEYLFNFPTSIKAIMCTCPWVKIIIILRNPTDRVWSHYNFLQHVRTNNGKPPINMSFEQFILKDAKTMSTLDISSFQKTEGKDEQALSEEDIVEAWFEYKQEFPEGPLGRSMYALQIHQWFKELRRIGRDPKNAVRIVRLEDLKRGGKKAAQILNELADWVLPNDKHNATSPIEYLDAFRHGMKTNYTKLGSPQLSQDTKDILDRLYAPHNELLARLLGDERWRYSRDDTDEQPLVWPANKGGEGNAVFERTSIDQKGPCASR